MKKIIIPILIILLILGVLISLAFNKLKTKGLSYTGLEPLVPNIETNSSLPGEDLTNSGLKVPDNYKISIFAKTNGNPRDLELDPKGNLLVSLTSQGKIVKLPEDIVVVDKLNKPHGIAFFNGKLYVAETDKISFFDYNPDTFKASNKVKIFDLPNAGFHFTRSIIFKDGKLYVSSGSSCNVCNEEDPKRASIWQLNPDGSDAKPYAIGLRNSVFMTVNPKTHDIWATDMGRDLLGDDTPPDEVNIIKPANYFGNQPYHYGWPYCFADKQPDPETNKDNSKFNCGVTVSPHIAFQAHSAPLGLAFWQNDVLVSFHGSWNRTEPTGYKVVRVKLDNNGNPIGQPEDFISGWLHIVCAKVPKGEQVIGDGCSPTTASGRPVDILVKNENEIYISDDKANIIYLLRYQ